VWLEGLGKLKKFTSPDLEPTTFQRVAEYLNFFPTAYPHAPDGSDLKVSLF
jgi:hypothetical protein